MTTRRALIAVGGFPGTGKSSVSRQLAAGLSIPRLDSDTIGKTIHRTLDARIPASDAFRAGYDVLFALARDHLAGMCSVVVDLSLGWPFQWRELDRIVADVPGTAFVPIVLRCDRQVCRDRLQQRHLDNPQQHPPAEQFLRQPQLNQVWDFLAALDRPDVLSVDAAPALKHVHEVVLAHLKAILAEHPNAAPSAP